MWRPVGKADLGAMLMVQTPGMRCFCYASREASHNTHPQQLAWRRNAILGVADGRGVADD
jgi:hypothetical protein